MPITIRTRKGAPRPKSPEDKSGSGGELGAETDEMAAAQVVEMRKARRACGGKHDHERVCRIAKTGKNTCHHGDAARARTGRTCRERSLGTSSGHRFLRLNIHAMSSSVASAETIANGGDFRDRHSPDPVGEHGAHSNVFPRHSAAPDLNQRAVRLGGIERVGGRQSSSRRALRSRLLGCLSGA